jgi:ADP-heptose:LPS heptosyltransferase
VIYPTYSRESLGDAIVKVSKATERIGQVGNTDNISQWQKNITDRFYTKLIPIEGSPLTEIERNRKFAESLGALVIHAPLPSLTVSDTEVAAAQRFLISRGLKNKPYAVINPGSQAPFKRWPLKCFAEVIDYLHTHYGLEIVLTGIPSERYLGENIQKMTRVKVIDTIGWTSFVELSAILKKSILYVGNDTGTVHIAAAVGTPTVCIMGGGHFGRFFPYGDLTKNRIVYDKNMSCKNDNWRCAQTVAAGQPAPCIQSIPVEDVIKEIDEILRKQ